jgi:hypothetical protein
MHQPDRRERRWDVWEIRPPHNQRRYYETTGAKLGAAGIRETFPTRFIP